MRRIPALALAGVVAASTPLAAQNPPPPRYYTVADLGPGDAFRILGLGLGYTIGALNGPLCDGASGARFGFFWDGTTGKRRLLCPLPGETLSEVFDFELLGAKSAVGYSRSAAGNDRPVLWDEDLTTGAFTPRVLGMPSGSGSGVAWGTELMGSVLGEVAAGGERRAAYWFFPFPNWEPTVFPFAGSSAAFTIAGSFFDPLVGGQHAGKFALWYPRRWPSAVTYPLGETPSVGFRLREQSNVFQAVGQFTTPGGSQGFLWQSDPPGVTPLPNLAFGNQGAARDFLDASHIVGFSSDNPGQSRAVLWEGPFLYDLNDLMLPTCRDDDPVACAPWTLETASSISDAGVIVGSGTLGGEHHAFLAKPVEMLSWNAAVCAETAQPLCVPAPARTSTELIIDPYQEKDQEPPVSASAANSYAAAADAYVENNGIWIPNAAASFRSYAVFEPKSVIDALARLPGAPTRLDVRFHFKVDGSTASSSGPNAVGNVGASMALRPARNAGEYSYAGGSMSTTSGVTSRYGVFAGQGTGSTGDVELPLQIGPFYGDGSLEVRIEAGAAANTLASGPTWASADASVRFCSEDPRSITLADGTALADLGIKYTLWPTVRRREDEDDPCRNPLKEQVNVTPRCEGGGGGGGNSSFRFVSPPVIQAGERVELVGVARPPGGTLSAAVTSANGTVEGYRPCTTYPDGGARCPVTIRANPTFGPDDVMVVRLVYSYNEGGFPCRFESTALLTGSRLQFIDPIVGENPPLIDPAVALSAQPVQFLKRDPALLARSGRRVRGLAADGVTPVILRFRAPGPGAVTFTVTDDRGSREQARAGRLSDSLSATPTAYQNPVTVDARLVDGAYWAFAVLTSPRDFVRPSVPSDVELGQSRPRRLPVQVDFAPTGGGSAVRVSRPLDLVRPPVTLIHGIWSDGRTWKWPLLQDGRFFRFIHDYGSESGRSYLQNYKQGYYGVRNTLNAMRQKNWAVTQADVVGHSMGSILARIYLGGRDYARNRGVPAGQIAAVSRDYKERVNFGAGTVHKLIMVDSPQFGSKAADFTSANNQKGLQYIYLLKEKRALDGAVADLRRLGEAIRALPTVEVPVHAMIGKGGREYVESYFPTPVAIAPGWIGTLSLFLQFKTAQAAGDFFDDLYAPEFDYDVVVGECSQKAGLSGAAVRTVTLDPTASMHLNNTGSVEYSNEAVSLLNAAVGSDKFAARLLPPPATEEGLCATALAPGAIAPPRRAPVSQPVAAPPARVLDGGLVITSPAPGSVVTAGSEISVTVEAALGFVPTRIVVAAGSGTQLVEAPRFDGTVRIPLTDVGDVELRAVGLDAQDELAAAAPITVKVEAPAPVTALTPLNGTAILSAAVPRTSLRITGAFGDGVDRDLTASGTGTTYESQDPAVATVDGEGVVTALKSGSTLVRAANGGQEAVVEVTVTSTPFDADGDGDVDLGDFLDLRGCWSGPGEDEGFEAPSNACRDTFDADADGDVDADDYAAFQARYTGPQADCNGNGVLDLTDIVLGTSLDADGNGIPDECGS